MTKKIVAIGTTSKHKVTAAKSAIARAGKSFDLRAVKTSSGIPEQPVGIEETRRGAVNRASAALAQVPEADAGLGVESGLIPIGHAVVDLAIVAWLERGKEPVYATSTGIQFPNEDFARSLATNRSVTAGDFIAKRMGGDGTDPHSTLTGGRLPRNETLEQAILAELVNLPG